MVPTDAATLQRRLAKHSLGVLWGVSANARASLVVHTTTTNHWQTTISAIVVGGLGTGMRRARAGTASLVASATTALDERPLFITASDRGPTGYDGLAGESLRPNRNSISV